MLIAINRDYELIMLILLTGLLVLEKLIVLTMLTKQNKTMLIVPTTTCYVNYDASSLSKRIIG